MLTFDYSLYIQEYWFYDIISAMRLDKYLKVSRIIKRRTVAK